MMLQIYAKIIFNIIENLVFYEFYLTSNDRGITPRCGDPGVFIPCIVKDFPHLEKERF